MMADSDDQAMLSRFDAGDVSRRDLSVDSFDRKRETEAYAESVTTGGWALVLVTEETIGWHNPDGPSVYKLKRKSAGWRGHAGGIEVPPSYTKNLQIAIDRASEWLAANPVDEEGDG